MGHRWRTRLGSLFEGWIEQFTHRPLLVAAVSLSVGIAAHLSVLNLIFIALIVVFAWYPIVRYWAICSFVLGWLLAPAIPTERAQAAPFVGEVDVISAAHASRDGDSLTVRSPSYLYLLKTDLGSDINLGDRLHIEGSVKPITGAFGENLLSQGVVGELRPSKIEYLQSGSGIWKIGKAVRNSFSSFLSETLPAHTAATVDALAFNNDAKLDQELKGFLKATGTIHIISTSGMHVMMLAWAIMWVLSRLPVSRLVQILVLGALLLLYVAAAGWRPPAVRAVVLILTMLLPYVFNRQPDALSALSLAYLLAVIVNPVDILEIGLQLSYVSLLGLVLFGGYSNVNQSKLWKAMGIRLWMMFRMSCVASIATIPLSAYFFGQFSIIAPIANLAIAFVVLPIVAGALIAWPISWLFPAIGSLILLGVGALANYIEAATSWMSTWPGAVIQIEPFPAHWLTLFYALLVLLWEPKKLDSLKSENYPA